jgi:hypothetical protein
VKTLSCNSGAWDTVATKTINIELQKGQNSIRLSNANDWMPDIDYIQLKNLTVPTGIQKPAAKHPTGSQAYNLQGQKVKPADAHHEVIIENGIKVLKK